MPGDPGSKRPRGSTPGVGLAYRPQPQPGYPQPQHHVAQTDFPGLHNPMTAANHVQALGNGSATHASSTSTGGIVNVAAANPRHPTQHQYLQPLPYGTMTAPYSADAHHDNGYSFAATSQSPQPTQDGFGSEAANSTTEPADSTPKHTRSYQACNACRARKTKCIMGNPDKPHEGPCQKCRRERKDCVFNPTRKKVKTDLEAGDSASDNARKRSKRSVSEASMEEPAIRNQAAPTHNSAVNTVRSPNTFLNTDFLPLSPNLTTANSYNPRMRPPPRSTPQNHMNMSNGFDNPPSALLRTGGITQSDNQLHHSPLVADLMSGSVASSQQGMHMLLQAAGEANMSASVSGSPQSDSIRSRTYSNTIGTGPADLEVQGMTAQQVKELQSAISVWSRMRFIRAGWFTPHEAMTWVDYFYQNLAPMTPVSLPDFRAPSKHQSLLSDEPVLALTILAIASRQLPLRGSASMSRSHNVHDKLWISLRATIERLLWGQEQFGGGFCGAGAAFVKESDTGQISWKGSLRTLGTIEALLLLTDWQPRALHFPPPGDDEGHLLDESALDTDSALREDQKGSNVPFAFALEPAWRSDRMSWMLLGLAQSLSHELGVFNLKHTSCQNDHGKGSECVRKRRIWRLVHTYVAQTSGRLGIQSMLNPEEAGRTDYGVAYTDDVDAVHDRWFELATIMFRANREIFETNTQTRELTRSGEYTEKIAPLADALSKWKLRFKATSHLFSPVMRDVLSMEYEYSRMFINSLGFNKVVDSWREQGPQLQQGKIVQSIRENEVYIKEVREASTSLVQTLLDGFARKNQLRNAAIRTYLRAFAGMVFTLKLFSLGNHEITVRKSLNLLERVAAAMQQQVVDDVHISNLIAEQVKTLAASVTRSMIRIQKPGGSNPSSREQSLRQSPVQLHNTVKGHRQTHSHSGTISKAPADSSPDPLAEIRARPMADYSTQTFMPPPNMAMNFDTGDANGDDMAIDPSLDVSMQFDFDNTDWFALPLDPILTNTGDLTVEPGLGGVGPTMGGRDLLDYLAPSDTQNIQGQFDGWPGNLGFDGL